MSKQNCGQQLFENNKPVLFSLQELPGEHPVFR